jgi:hypothetical protein
VFLKRAVGMARHATVVTQAVVERKQVNDALRQSLYRVTGPSPHVTPPVMSTFDEVPPSRRSVDRRTGPVPTDAVPSVSAVVFVCKQRQRSLMKPAKRPRQIPCCLQPITPWNHTLQRCLLPSDGCRHQSAAVKAVMPCQVKE